MWMADTSAAYIIGIVSITVGLIGTLLLTVVDPIMQTLFDSGLWSADTPEFSNLLVWQQDIWTYWAAFILFGIMIYVWIRTRQPV